MLPPGITKVIAKDDLGETPARCYRDTGIVLTNNKKFPLLSKDIQDFIIAHEAGHICQDTDNEFLADDFAFKWCISRGMGLKNCVYALTQVLTLPTNNPDLKREQEQRMEVMLEKALEYDYKINKNEKANPMSRRNTRHGSEFLGIAIGKKAQARKTAKQDAKNQAKILKAQAKVTLAQQGQSSLGQLGQGLGNVAQSALAFMNPMANSSALSNVVDSLGNNMGISPAVQPPLYSSPGIDKEDAGGNKLIMGMKPSTVMIIAAVVVVVIIVVVVFIRRKK